ncbi:MAG TPA: hypothetical protein VGX76_25590 [Pirellulales bacterium]|jgi:hypothetical protein|nr:hypothetical protein [Pirellulales bacterium]
MAATRSTCVECGATLSASRLLRHALTCSARCGEARRARQGQQRHAAKRRRTAPPEATPAKNPPILGVTLTEAAERVGISRAMAHTLCVEHGLGRLCNDGRFWLTLAELRKLTIRPWRERTE